MCGYECLGPNASKNTTVNEEFMLEKAIANLRRTDCVAITDRLYDLVDQLRLHVTWIPANVAGFPHQNIVPLSQKSVLDDEAETILARWGWADAKLYEEAAKIAQEKTALAKTCAAKRRSTG